MGLDSRFQTYVFVFRLFFFSSAWIVTSHEFTVWGTKNNVHGSHGTIHIFKNYFVTVFLISTKINYIQTDYLLLKKILIGFINSTQDPLFFGQTQKC